MFRPAIAFKLALLVLLLWPAAPVYSAPANPSLYVIDQLQVGVRRGPSTDYATVDVIRTGDKVTFLGESGDKLWVRVTTPNNREGWVSRRYLVDSPPAALLLRDSSPEENADLAAVLENLRLENEKSKTALAESEAQNKNLESRLARLSNDCSSSISLRDNLDETQQKLKEQEQALQTLQAENQALNFTSNLRWFLAGGAVLLAGWFIGWLFGRRNKRTGGYGGKLRY